jgi:hypothetical protein
MWQGLVSEDIPVNTDEIERLDYILKLYEKENLRLVRENEAKQSVIDAHERKRGEMDVGKQGLLKKIKSLEQNLKYERMAGEGLTKKAGIYEVEINQLKEEKRAYEQQHELELRHLAKIQSTFNKDRARLLQYVHEIELLTEEKGQLERRVKRADDELLMARTDLLKKIQYAESMLTRTGQQQKLVHEQAEEMLALTREVYELRMRKNDLVETSTDQEIKIGRYEHTIERLTAEVQRLRRELLEIAATQTQKSLAFCTGLSPHRVATKTVEANHGDRRIVAATSPVSASQGFRDAFNSSIDSVEFGSVDESRTGSTIPSRQAPPPTSVISPASTAYRPQLSSIQSHSKSLTWGPSSSIPLISTGMTDIISTQSSPSIIKRSKTAKTAKTGEPKSALNADYDGSQIKDKKGDVHDLLSGMGNKSLFLGQGLGLKQDREPAFSATGGTAKQVLKKILDDFNSQH